MYKIPATTLFLGKNLVFLPECHSTNDLALQMSQQSTTPEGTVVITDSQISGRGQRGNTWEAQKGLNFTLSIILKPSTLTIRDQFYLNIFTSLAIADYIKSKSHATIRIKWPNDILVDGKKLCGILIENQIQGNKFSNSIIGIGLNMNQKTFSVSTATSLSIVLGEELDLHVELEFLLQKLEARYLQLRSQQYEILMSDYLSNLHWLNEKHTFISQDVEFEGTIDGVDDVGRLKITTDGGERYFGLKEVSYGY